jgi:hypothetical protein
MLFLIVVFLVVNAVFLIQYILDGDSGRRKQGKKDVTGYLKNYVDFNDTTFERDSVLFFHFPKYSDHVIKSGNVSGPVESSEFYIDNEVIVDRELSLCSFDDFDIDRSLCLRNSTELIRSCVNSINCCDRGYMCYFRCILGSNDSSYCTNRCKLYLLHNGLYCYYNELDIASLNITTYQVK